MRNRLTAFENAWSMLDRLQRDLDWVGDRGVGNIGWGETGTNVWTSEDEATVAFELPGLELDAIDVTLDKGLLTVKCDRPAGETKDQLVMQITT